MKECLYYESIDGDIKCKLCPHYCTVKEGRVGICGVRENIGGKLYSLNYGVVSAYAVDPIEKKPLFHFYPGKTIASIGTFGCNFKCEFCQNHNISMGENVSELKAESFKSSYNYISPETLLERIADQNRLEIEEGASGDNIGIAFTYNEPTIWYEYVLDVSRLAKERGMKTVLVTNGFINKEPFEELLEHIDAVNMDLKAFNEKFYSDICYGKLDPVKESIKIAAENTHLEISTLLIDGLNTEDTEIESLSKFLSDIDRTIPVHFNRYHPSYKMKNEATSVNTLIKAKKIAAKYLDYVYIGNIAGYDNNTFCPGCGGRLIEREFYSGRLLNAENGSCSKCGRAIDIIV